MRGMSFFGLATIALLLAGIVVLLIQKPSWLPSPSVVFSGAAAALKPSPSAEPKPSPLKKEPETPSRRAVSKEPEPREAAPVAPSPEPAHAVRPEPKYPFP